MHAFVLRTHDRSWIERHGGVVDGDGRVTVMVEQVERFTFAGRDHLRADFSADCPADFPNGHVMCPVALLAK